MADKYQGRLPGASRVPDFALFRRGRGSYAERMELDGSRLSTNVDDRRGATTSVLPSFMHGRRRTPDEQAKWEDDIVKNTLSDDARMLPPDELAAQNARDLQQLKAAAAAALEGRVIETDLSRKARSIAEQVREIERQRQARDQNAGRQTSDPITTGSTPPAPTRATRQQPRQTRRLVSELISAQDVESPETLAARTARKRQQQTLLERKNSARVRGDGEAKARAGKALRNSLGGAERGAAPAVGRDGPPHKPKRPKLVSLVSGHSRINADGTASFVKGHFRRNLP